MRYNHLSERTYQILPERYPLASIRTIATFTRKPAEATLRAIDKRQVDISTIEALETEPITWPGRGGMV
jgi:hypothetical protein